MYDSPYDSRRPLHTGRFTYADYLCLDQLLSAQRPCVLPPHEDELLFIVQHQVTELWFKLLLHELRTARERLRLDQQDACLAALERSHQVQLQLVGQWSVLETLEGPAFMKLRPALGNASGLQSVQYKELELLLGSRRPGLPAGAPRRREVRERLLAMAAEPGLFDELLRYLARHGHPLPRHCLERDWTEPRRADPAVVDALRHIYHDPKQHRAAHRLCERLAALDRHLRRWRLRHLRIVERLIDTQPGTGGTAGAKYLEKLVDRRYFPELHEARR